MDASVLSLHVKLPCPNCGEKRVMFSCKERVVDWYSAICHHCRTYFNVVWDEETAEIVRLEGNEKPKIKRPWLQKISDAQVEEIRKLWQGGVTQLDLSQRYKVSQPTIYRIVHGVART